MKKVLLLFILLGLTGCGKKSCDFTFDGNMTEDYAKDAKKCSVVTYLDKRKNFKVITTPSDDGKSFIANFNYNGNNLWYSFSDTRFINTRIRKYKKKNLMILELYVDRKIANMYLVLLDIDGNLKYELANTSSPIIDGDNLIVREYLTIPNTDEYLCKDYNTETIAYREITYNISDMTPVSSKEIPIKDICS